MERNERMECEREEERAGRKGKEKKIIQAGQRCERRNRERE